MPPPDKGTNETPSAHGHPKAPRAGDARPTTNSMRLRDTWKQKFRARRTTSAHDNDCGHEREF